MAFHISKPKSNKSIDNYAMATTNTFSSDNNQSEFYELELGVVTDIVLDETHPVFTKLDPAKTSLDYLNWPENIDKEQAKSTDRDYTWIGRALVRPLISGKTIAKDKLTTWAKPLESNISEYPLINELVVLVQYRGDIFYSRKLNLRNLVNNNLDFSAEPGASGRENTELYTNPLGSVPFKGPISSVKYKADANYKGVAGRYFKTNNRIRNLRRYEGDLLIESRFGQSIHFTAYDSIRDNDKGDPTNEDYKDGGGNPMILIRNRQRPLVKENKTKSLHENVPSIHGTSQEKNVGGYIEEDINNDGSSIHITSGLTKSKWKSSCYKRMFAEGMEEQPSYSPEGCSSFTFPDTLDGDQIVIQSDRLIFSSRFGETFHFSKARYGVVTDSEYTVDAHDQIVLTTNVKTVINSPAIYLGEYDQTGEPAVLGQQLCSWLTALCDWLEVHVHKHQHSHVDAGNPSPEMTQEPIDPHVQQLKNLKGVLQTILSRRVFVTGGGWAPGSDGKEI